jgi:5-methylcytosine-specific restriction protein A
MSPSKPPHPCAHPGCGELVTTGSRCQAHAKVEWKARNARPEIREDKKFYDSALWRKTRLAVLKREPWCRECKRLGIATLATVVDHIIPLRMVGPKVSPDNLQPLCAACHNVKRSEESRQGGGS